MKFKRFLYLIAFISIQIPNMTGQNWDTKLVKVGFSTDLRYCEKLDRIFVSLYNKILIINPNTGSVLDSIVVGDNNNLNGPTILKIAVSDDGQYLYFAKRQETKVYRYKLSNKSKDLEIPVGEPILDLEVMPGRPQTIAVTRFDSRDLAIFDNAIKRTNTVNQGFENIVNVIFAYKDSTTLYGSDASSSNKFMVIKIDNTGVAIKSAGYGLLSEFGGGIYSSSKDGFVYTNKGYKINLTVGKVPIIEGSYGERGNSQLINNITSGYFVADQIQNKVYALVQLRDFSNLTDSTQLAVFNKATFNLDTIYTLPIKFNFVDYANELIEWGSGKMAILADDNLILLRQCTSQNTIAPTILEGTVKTGCNDSLVTLTASGNFSRYAWSNGDTGRIIRVKNIWNKQIISVAAMDTEGCVSPYSVPTTLMFESQLEVPNFYVADQKTATCKGDSINLTAYAGTSQIIWSNGAKGNSTWVKQTGDYSMYAVTENGCKTLNSAAQKVTVFDFQIPPRPTIKIDRGDTVLCEGASITLSGPTGFSLYKWSNGDNQRVTTITPANSQEISLRVSDTNGCQSPPSISISLERLYKPYPIPQITRNGNILASSNTEGNQWFLNGNPIMGATQQFYKPLETGLYTVKYSVRGCFSDPSLGVQF